MQRSGKLPQHPPISVSFIERACGETFMRMLWHFSACAFCPPVRYKMQRLPYPPHMSRGTLGVAAAFAFTMNSAHAAACWHAGPIRAERSLRDCARLTAGEAVGGAARVRIRPDAAT